MALDEYSANAEIIGRDEINDLEAILSVSNTDVDEAIHTVEDNADAIFTWDYEKGARPALNKLYEKAKHAQWNGETDLPWETEVDLEKNAALQRMQFAEMETDVTGTPLEKFTEQDFIKLSIESDNWTLSQFMHGEQGALICTAKIVETVPWIDAKYYASTQVMDEARHVEVFAKYLQEKQNGFYPINAHLKMLLDDIISDSRWDMTYLGMQIMVEGLALAAFGFMQQMTPDPLLKQLLRYVMSDEARHVAFGVLSLKEYYAGLTDAELRERQEFAFEAADPHAGPLPAAGGVGAHGHQAQGDPPRRHQGPRPADVPADAVLEDRAQLQEARPARRRRRLAAHQVHRDGRHPVRGLAGHRRGVRGAAGHRLSRPAPRPVHRSGIGPSTGLTSRTGVPSTASRPSTRTRVPSVPTIRTVCRPIGLGRSGERVLNTPSTGAVSSLRGWVVSTSRRARSSHVSTTI